MGRDGRGLIAGPNGAGQTPSWPASFCRIGFVCVGREGRFLGSMGYLSV